MKSLVSRHVLAVSIAALVGLLGAGNAAHAQITTTGTIYGTGWGVTLSSTQAVRDSNWSIVALPSGFTPPDSQSLPYLAYVPYSTPGVYTGGGSPQSGQVYLGGTNYWIAPQVTTASLQPFGVLYNWIAQQQFVVPQAGFYKFGFPGAGDNELEFFIDGTVNTTDPKRPTITGGQQIGGRAGTFSVMSNFVGGALLTAGTHTASMVLWDYGGDTAAIIGSSTFAPAVAYWAPSSGAGGNGTWTNTNVYWSSTPDGSGTKGPWTDSAGYAYFGGTSGTVTVGENVTAVKLIFTTGGYQVQGGGGQITYGDVGASIIGQTGTSTVSVAQIAPSGLTVTGNGTVILSGTTGVGYGKTVLVDGSKLLVNGVIDNAFGTLTVTNGSLGGTGTIISQLTGNGMVNPGLTGTASGILAATQLNPSNGLDFTFVFSGTAPTFGNTSNSVNDVLRLTANPTYTAPFTSALTSSNSKTLFLNFTKEQLTLGTTLKGGFFTDASTDFVSMLNNQTWDNGGFQVYVLGDGLGTDNSLNGQGYYNWRNPAMFGWTQSLFLSTEAQTANFGSGNVDGRIMTLAVGVPEPSTYALGLAGAGFLGLMKVSRARRRSRRRGPAPQPAGLS